MMETRQTKRKIADPWYVEIEVIPKKGERYFITSQTEAVIAVNLISNRTGEIRQKRVSLDTFARRIFKSEINTWRNRWLGSDYEVGIVCKKSEEGR